MLTITSMCHMASHISWKFEICTQSCNLVVYQLQTNLVDN
jgi:hypothetical protein